MSALINQDITVLRAVAGSYVNGKFTSSEPIEITVKGVITTKVQQNFQRQLEYDIDLKGSDLDGYISVVTINEPLKTVETSELKRPDIVIFNTKMYEIISSSGIQKIVNSQHYRHVARYKKD